MDDIQFSEFLDESIPLWRNDPVMFFREVLNLNLMNGRRKLQEIWRQTRRSVLNLDRV